MIWGTSAPTMEASKTMFMHMFEHMKILDDSPSRLRTVANNIVSKNGPD